MKRKKTKWTDVPFFLKTLRKTKGNFNKFWGSKFYFCKIILLILFALLHWLAEISVRCPIFLAILWLTCGFNFEICDVKIYRASWSGMSVHVLLKERNRLKQSTHWSPIKLLQTRLLQSKISLLWSYKCVTKNLQSELSINRTVEVRLL
jgi:hypothetical protein